MASAGEARLRVSVILPVRNEEAHLGQVLDDLAHQTLAQDQYEVIVVDGMSEDATADVAQHYAGKFANFSFLTNPARLSSAARNLGIEHARGEYLIFIDGHCQIPSETLLADMLDIFAQSGVKVLCRPQPLTMEPSNRFGQAVAAARASWLGHGLDSTIYTDEEIKIPAASSGAMYHRSVFDQIGRFDERFDACEDVELNTRVDFAGIEAFISPKLTVQYAPRQSAAALWRQLWRYGIGRWRLFRKHPRTLGLGTLLPPLMALGLPLILFWAVVHPPFAMILLVLYLIYAVLVMATSAYLLHQKREEIIPELLAVFPIIHFALGCGFLCGPWVRRR
ncbi:MAG: glycosyltransferase [bacterium]